MPLGTTSVTTADIKAYARAFDPQPLHLDEEAAKHTMIGRLCASGWHSCAILMRLLCDGFLLDASSLGSPGMAEVKFLRPVFPDEPLSARWTCLSKRPLKLRADVGSCRMDPFFSASSPLTQATIQIAQQQDQIALEQFTARFRDLVQRAANLDKNVESEVILLLKAQLEQQYTLCTGLPGQPATICDAIKKLIITIIATLRDTSKNDPHALEKLATDEEHSMLHLQLCEHQIVSDILNPDVIIPEHEQTPTLLNESGDALQAALTLFPPERIKVMIDEGKALLKNIEAGGQSVPTAWQRLAQMERWFQDE